MTSPQSNSSPILITGGTGKTGSRIAKRLTDSGFSRADRFAFGHPAFDWNDRGTWAAALQGGRAVYVAFQPDLAAPGALKIVEPFFQQALAAGVKKIVLLSGRGEEEAQDAENALHSHRVPIGPSCAPAGSIRTSPRHSSIGCAAAPWRCRYVPIPEPFIDVEDIAEIGFRALTQDGPAANSTRSPAHARSPSRTRSAKSRGSPAATSSS